MIILGDDDGKQKRLEELLLRLSKEEEFLTPICNGKERKLISPSDKYDYLEELQAIYAGNFRHQYAPLYEIVREIGEDSTVFESNISAIYRDCAPHIKERFFEFIDQLNLEFARFVENQELTRYHDALKNDLDKELNKQKNLKAEIATLEKQLKKSRNKIVSLEKMSKSVQKDFVAILAIFAAVVIAFSSGSGYVLSSIAAVSSAPLDKLISVVLVCGFVLMNALFMLMYFISKIVGRELGAKWWLVLLLDVMILALIWMTQYTAFFAPKFWP